MAKRTQKQIEADFQRIYELVKTTNFTSYKEIAEATKHVGSKDHKTVLQEKLQIHGDVKIEYEITKETGPDHDKSFEAQVKCNGKILAKGTGKSKKEAEMQAAKKALNTLK